MAKSLGLSLLNRVRFSLHRAETARHWSSCPGNELSAGVAPRARGADDHTRVMIRVFSRRCHGRPTTSASKLRLGQRAGRRVRLREAALVQAPRGAPDTEAVVDEELYTRAARIWRKGSRGAPGPIRRPAPRAPTACRCWSACPPVPPRAQPRRCRSLKQLVHPDCG
jgi:hypothetical protein